MKVLAMDTSNKAMAVALAEDDSIVATKKINIKRNHSIQLMPAVEELIQEVNWQPSDLDRIAVAKGPGSYTGVRIAVTTAKSLAWALDCPVVTYSSLEALALGQTSGYICPIFDARRENVYTGLYYSDETGELKSVKPDQHIALSSWLEELRAIEEPILFVGEDVVNFESQIKETLGSKAIYLPQADQLPNVELMAKQAENRDSVLVHELVPEYLKLTEAEENWMKDNPNEKRGHLVEKVDTKA